MNKPELLLLLPVLWAIVATAIGLVLYRSSNAFFESDRLPSLPAKQIRLTGSVVIAALAFLGMRQATPVSAMEDAVAGMRARPEHEYGTLVESSRRLESQMMELAGCAEMTQSLVGCQSDISAARRSSQQVRELSEAMAGMNAAE